MLRAFFTIWFLSLISGFLLWLRGVSIVDCRIFSKCIKMSFCQFHLSACLNNFVLSQFCCRYFHKFFSTLSVINTTYDHVTNKSFTLISTFTVLCLLFEFIYVVQYDFVSPFRVKKFLSFNVFVIMYTVMSVKLTKNCAWIMFVLRQNSLNTRIFVGFKFRCLSEWIIYPIVSRPHVC